MQPWSSRWKARDVHRRVYIVLSGTEHYAANGHRWWRQFSDCCVLICLTVNGSSWEIASLASIALLVGCKSERLWTTNNLQTEVRLVFDSPDVRLLIAAQERTDAAELRWLQGSQPHDERVHGVEDRRRHPQVYSPKLLPFIEAMAAKPGFAVRGGVACWLIESSRARCTPDPLDTQVYVKVRIVSGPNRDQEGWACEVRDVVSTTPGFF
jgi:hypothetical protein